MFKCQYINVHIITGSYMNLKEGFRLGLDKVNVQMKDISWAYRWGR